MLIKNNPGIFRDEILDCLTEHLEDSPEDTLPEKKKHAAQVLIQAFIDNNEDYYTPTYKSLLAVMKTLAVREMKNKKDTKKISDNFMRIAKKIKAAEFNIIERKI